MTDNPFVTFLKKYRKNPVAFVEKVLEVKPDPWQRDLLQEISKGTRRLSVRSGHGVGKSSVASWTIIWYFLTRYPCKVVVTAPTASQLFDALFSEVRSWIKKLPEGLQGLLEVTSDRVILKSAPQDAFISCRTSRADASGVEAMQGVHSENVLLVIDEASGIPEPVFEAAAGSMSGESATTLMLSNPVRSSGTFYDSHNRLKNEWHAVHVSCLDSPRVSKEFIREMAVRYGEDSSAYSVRCLGEFPKSDEDTVIPLGLVEAAQDRDIETAEDSPYYWGVDVSRYGGDESVLAVRQGHEIKELLAWKNKDLMQLTGIIVEKYNDLPPSKQPKVIYVDSIGIGAGVCDRCKELGLPVRGINVAESPSMKEKYLNLRAELWFRAKEFFEERTCKIPHDEILFSQLVAPRYTFNSQGRIKVESKDDMKKRGLRSPDRADALMLTLASEPAIAAFGAKYLNWKNPIKRGLRSIV